MAKIFLIDDDQDLANLTKMTLVKSGYEVSIFHEAKKAIEEARKQKPNLILMDIMLPGVDGGEAVKELKKDTSLKNIPVIFLTALVSPEENLEKAGIAIDGVNYKTFGKPYEIEQLLKVIKSSLR